jgi:hypothetical protein
MSSWHSAYLIKNLDNFYIATETFRINDSAYVMIQLVPYDAVNRNKVSIRQLSLFYFPSYSRVEVPI